MGLWLLGAQDVNVPQEMIARSKEVILDQKINLPESLVNIKLTIPLCCHNSISTHTDLLPHHYHDERSSAKALLMKAERPEPGPLGGMAHKHHK